MSAVEVWFLVLVAIAVWFATPARADLSILAPPEAFAHAGRAMQEAGNVWIWERPAADVNRYCAGSGYELREGERFYGCAVVLGGVCIVTIADDLPAGFRRDVVEHELAHCSGWTHE